MQLNSLLRYSLAAVTLSMAASMGATETADLITIISPNPCPVEKADDLHLFFYLDGEVAAYHNPYAGSYWKGEPLTVNNEAGEKYTEVYLQYIWDTKPGEEAYYLCLFDELPTEGTYSIVAPQGSFQVVDQEGDITFENKATEIKIRFGEGTGENPDTPEIPGFKPQSIYPPANSSVDTSLTDWLIALTFDTNVSIVEGMKPYLLFGDERIDPDSFASMSYLGNPEQVNATFNGMNLRPNGTYTFVLPAGTLKYANGRVNQEYQSIYTWTGEQKENESISGELVAATLGQYNLLDSSMVISTIAPNTTLSLTVEPAAVKRVWFSLKDVTGLEQAQYADADGIFTNSIETKTGNVFSKDIYSIEGYTLYEGHQYVLKVDLYTTENGPLTDVADTVYSAVFSGGTEAFKFSPVDILSITPPPGSDFSVGEQMVVTYSAPVTLLNEEGKCGFSLGQSGWSRFANMSPNEDRTVWTIEFQSSDITSATGPGEICPHLAGIDDNGLVLRPAKYDVDPSGALVFNYGTDANSYTEVHYGGYENCPKVIVTPSGSEPVESLENLTFTIEGDKELNLSYSVTVPVITNEAGETVATLLIDDATVTISSGSVTDPVNKEILIPLSEPITATGIYTLELPLNFFNVGRQLDTLPSAPGSYTIHVESSTGAAEIVAEETAEYFTLQGIRVEKPEKGIYIRIAGGKALKIMR